MVASALASSPHPRRRSTRAQAEADAAARHRLDVIAASVPDVIGSAGGWLADRALAGWDVNVFVPDTDDVAPLRILGVTPHRLAEMLPTRRDPRPPTAVAISADMVAGDAAVREQLISKFVREIPEVTMWGSDVPQGMGDRFHSVEHVLSAAARAFKSHAMRAAAIYAGAAAPTEVFHSGSQRVPGERLRLATVTDRAPSALPPAAMWAPAPGRTPSRVAR